MILDSVLLPFAAAHPVVAFLLAWPLVAFLLGIAACGTYAIVTGMNLVLQLANVTMILARGYGPSYPTKAQIEADDEKDKS